MTALARLRAAPWLGAFAAALAVWGAIAVWSGLGAGGQVAQAAFTFATFFVIVAIGQMFVVTLGPGHVDLSIPATLTLAGTVATKLMAETNAMILPRLLAALTVGLVVGGFNYGLIRLLRIPPITTTAIW